MAEWKDLLVVIFVPTFKYDGSDGRGKFGAIGTGYPIGQDLILTARHVLEPKKRDLRYSIAIRWYYYSKGTPNNGWHHVSENDVVWPESQELDVALLRCKRPGEAPVFHCNLSAALPQQGERWMSAGFPRAARRHEVRKHASFSGTMHSMSERENYFELNVDGGLSDEEDYKGSSGMPIFLESRPTILGIAKEVPRRFKSKKIHATPSWFILKDKNITSAIEQDSPAQDPARRRTYEAQLTEIFRGSNAAIALLEQPGHLLHEADLAFADKPAAAAAAAARGLLDAVDRIPVKEVVQRLSAAYRGLLQARQTNDSVDLAKAEDVLQRVVQLVVPYRFEHIAVELRRHMEMEVEPAIALPCCLSMVMEIFVAAAENRGTNYRPRESQEHSPDGMRYVGHPPEDGFRRPEQALAAIEEGLEQKVSPGGARELQCLVEGFAVKEFYKYPPPGITRSKEDQIRLAAIRFDQASLDNRYYGSCDLPKDEATRMAAIEGLRTIKKRFPKLLILGRASDVEVEISETDDFGLLVQMLPEKKI